MIENMESALDQAREFLSSRIPCFPKIAVILGTGLSSLPDRASVKVKVPYSAIPHFPISTVETHSGNLLLGIWGEREVAILQGRVHYYEGYSLQEVAFPVRVLGMLGVSAVLVTNAAGGLNPGFSPGDIMVITDHINLLGGNPLLGPNVETLGGRFPSMHEPYFRAFTAKLLKAAEEVGVTLRQGVYVGVSGPSLETPAETRFLRMIGADAVGMSTVPEVIAAVHAGIKVLGLSVISNVNNPEALAPASLGEVVANVEKALPHLARLLERFLHTFPREAE